MLRTDDIEGARPNKFKHSKRGYQISLSSPLSPNTKYISQSTKSTFAPYDSHDIFHLPKVTTKITGTDGSMPIIRSHNQYGAYYHIQDNKNNNTFSAYQLPNREKKIGDIEVDPRVVDNMRNPMYVDYNYSQNILRNSLPRTLNRSNEASKLSEEYSKSSYQGEISNEAKALNNRMEYSTGASQKMDTTIEEKYKKDILENIQYTPVNNYQNNNRNNIIPYPYPPREINQQYKSPRNRDPIYIQENLQRVPSDPSKIRNQSCPIGQDSIEDLKKEINQTYNETPKHGLNSDIIIKKALHNFYGVTPPASRNSEYYKKIQYKRENSNNNANFFRDSFYQKQTQDILSKAKNDTGFDRALKQFYGSPLTNEDNYKKNREHFYRGYTPIVGPKKFADVNLQSELNLNINSTYNLPYYIDPITHRKTHNINTRATKFTYQPARKIDSDPWFRANALRFFA